MKILILSVKAGMGHHATGMALKNEFESHGASCVMLDAFEYVTPILSETISRGYLLSTKLTPKMYGQFYRLAEKLAKRRPELFAKDAQPAPIVQADEVYQKL